MTRLSQDEFLKHKAILDKLIQRSGKLEDAAREASRECCTLGHLDARDKFSLMAAKAGIGKAAFEEMRSIAGGIEVPGEVERDGGT